MIELELALDAASALPSEEPAPIPADPEIGWTTTSDPRGW